MSVKRLFSEFEEATQCLDCGAAVERVFTPAGSDRMHIPVHMQAKHGGGLSWSDFHEETERELAKTDHIAPANRTYSQPGKGSRK